MADIAGGVINTAAAKASMPIAFAPGGAIEAPGARRPVYLLQAKDSVTGALYAWTLAALDLSGAGYPGPNAPTQIMVCGERRR